MAKISINLLPPEIAVQKKADDSKNLIIKISVVVLILMVGVAAFSLILSLLQRINIESVNNDLQKAQQKAGSFQEQEGLVFVLKDRLGAINRLIEQGSPDVGYFIFLTTLIPQNVEVFSFAVDSKRRITLAGEAQDSEALNELLINLSDPVKNEGKIVSTEITTLNRSRNGGLVFGMEVAMQ